MEFILYHYTIMSQYVRFVSSNYNESVHCIVTISGNDPGCVNCNTVF